jgi:hypothetical protein
LKIGLAIAALIGALAGASAAAAADKDKDTSAADVPALIQAKGLPCTVTASRTIVKGATMSDGSTASIYEVACQEGLGQVFISRNKEPKIQTEDCLHPARQRRPKSGFRAGHDPSWPRLRGRECAAHRLDRDRGGL